MRSAAAPNTPSELLPLALHVTKNDHRYPCSNTAPTHHAVFFVSIPGFPTTSLPRLAAKADRLKQAKDEAEREISTFKAEREADFKRKVCGRRHTDLQHRLA